MVPVLLVTPVLPVPPVPPAPFHQSPFKARHDSRMEVLQLPGCFTWCSF